MPRPLDACLTPPGNGRTCPDLGDHMGVILCGDLALRSCPLTLRPSDSLGQVMEEEPPVRIDPR